MPNNPTYPVGAVVKFRVTAKTRAGKSAQPRVIWRATGGTITSSGVYVAGNRTGVFRVIARQVGGSKSDTSRVRLTRTGNSLLSITIAPKTVSLAPRATTQFRVAALWANGSTAAPSVVYRATGGSVTSGGRYTAPASAGVYRVIVSNTTNTVSDTATVRVGTSSTGGGSGTGSSGSGTGTSGSGSGTTGGGGPVFPPSASGAWIDEDFSAYRSRADLMGNRRLYSVTEDVGASYMDLDQTDGCGTLCGIPSGRPRASLRYNIPDRSRDPNLCHDYTIGRNIQLPNPVQEIWVEVWAKFSSNFMTVVPSCSKVSSGGYKFIFMRVNGSERFNLIVGVFGNGNTWGYPGNLGAFYGGPPPSRYFDGQWHRWRFHTKVGLLGVATAYLDNTKIAQILSVNIKRNSIYGIALSRNMNQGPTHPISLNYGAVRAWRTDPGWGF